MSKIRHVIGREILDSRGNPTVEVDVILDCGTKGTAAVPSGASTGTHEAVELRDDDAQRFGGKGVSKAVESVNEEIAATLVGRDARNQAVLDGLLCKLDGTPNKSRLGANAILGASLAVARSAAASGGQPLYRYVGGCAARVMPIPMMNIINGGEHADNAIDIQEFMIVPLGAHTFRRALRMGAEVFATLRKKLSAAGLSTAVGDEGGFAPELASTRDALNFVLEAISAAGYEPGTDIQLALDCASTEYYRDGSYVLSGEGRTLTSSGNVAYLAELVESYPIFSIEDGCAEDDWEGWSDLTSTIGAQCHLIGDDLFVTSPARFQTGIDRGCANSILVKPNQVGTLTETLDVVGKAQRVGWIAVMSHRSGETEDTTISDLAVGTNCGFIKAGSLSRTDRVAKYNRLLRIEQNLGDAAIYAARIR